MQHYPISIFLFLFLLACSRYSGNEPAQSALPASISHQILTADDTFAIDTPDLANLLPPPPVDPNESPPRGLLLPDDYLPDVQFLRDIALLQEESEEPFVAVERMPEFPGGIGELGKFLINNYRWQTPLHIQNFCGRVYFQFTITATGQVTNMTIQECDIYISKNKVLEFQKKMPRWKPGIQDGKPVPVRYSLPMYVNIQPMSE